MYEFDAKIDTQIELNGVVYQFDGTVEFQMFEQGAPAELQGFEGSVCEMDEGNEVPMSPELLAGLTKDLEGSQWLDGLVVKFWEDAAEEYWLEKWNDH
jgi:hypothetical protein